MSGAVQFARFYVLLSDVWASQCVTCWQIIAFSPDRNELSLAEAAHQCLGKKPIATAAEETTIDKAVSK